MRLLLTEAVTLLCRNSLQYKQQVMVEGLIGITLDERDVLLVSIKETFESIAAELTSETTEPTSQNEKISAKRKRRRSRSDSIMPQQGTRYADDESVPLTVSEMKEPPSALPQPVVVKCEVDLDADEAMYDTDVKEIKNDFETYNQEIGTRIDTNNDDNLDQEKVHIKKETLELEENEGIGPVVMEKEAASCNVTSRNSHSHNWSAGLTGGSMQEPRTTDSSESDWKPLDTMEIFSQPDQPIYNTSFAQSCDQLLVCPACGIKTSNNANLRRHVRTVHLNIKPFKCGICKSKFSRKEHTATHITVKHNILGDVTSYIETSE